MGYSEGWLEWLAARNRVNQRLECQRTPPEPGHIT